MSNRSRGLVLTHGATTVDCRSKLIDCHDWGLLLGRGAYNVALQALPDFDGLEVGPQTLGGLRGPLEFRLNGAYTDQSETFSGDESARRDNMLSALNDLYTVLTAGEPITATVHEDQTYEGDLVVLDPDRPRTKGQFGWLVPEIVIPDGLLPVSA